MISWDNFSGWTRGSICRFLIPSEAMLDSRAVQFCSAFPDDVAPGLLALRHESLPRPAMRPPGPFQKYSAQCVRPSGLLCIQIARDSMSETLTPAGALSLPSRETAINPWFIAITVTLATFMELLDTAIANVALPHIAGGLAVRREGGHWGLANYLVSNGVGLPPSAWLRRLFGRKAYYMICLAR